MKKLICLSMLIVWVTASAQDSWTSADKEKHAIAGAGIGVIGTMITKDPAKGCMGVTGVGLLKELYDAQHTETSTPSVKDFAVTAIVGCIASYGTARVFISVENDRPFLGFTTSF